MLFLSLVASLLMSSVDTHAQQLAFPGADGYGKHVTGGRGGEVCYVTRLDDCSDNDLVPGTLRWALRHNNGGKPRTILFNVSGTIYLTSKLKFQYDDVSILGQSAPGGGICLAGYNMYICRNNIIIRYIRFRAGDIPNSSMTGLDLENAERVILDHCSMTWSMEECLTAYDSDYTTIQWCIIGEGLYSSKNAKGSRAYATQWGGEHSTMHHTLITNSHSRSPRFNGVRSASTNKGDHDYKVDSEFANNVVYNWWGSGAQYGGEYDKNVVEAPSWAKADPGYDRVYLINNYYRPGPSTKTSTSGGRYWCSPSSPYGEWYLSGNKFETSSKWAPTSDIWKDAELEKVNANNLYGAEESNSSRGINLTGSNASTYILKSIPYELSGMKYESADEAYKKVVTMAGASLPRYDEVDRRLLDEAAGQCDPKYVGAAEPLNTGIIDSPDDILLEEHDTYLAGGKIYTNYPFLGMREGEKYAIDTDGDGLPDLYENTVGLDANNASDGSAVSANGYTNLENYLNGIVDGTIDKSKYETSTYPVIPGLPATVTLAYTNNVCASTTVELGTAVTLPAETTAGEKIYGWVCQQGFFLAGEAYTFISDITLTAVVEVKYADCDEQAIYTGIGEKITLPKLQKDGYTFEGWTDGEKTFAGGVEYVCTSSVILTPVFKKEQGPSGTGTATVTWPCQGLFDSKGSQNPSGIFSATTINVGSKLTVVSKTDKLSPKTTFAGVQPSEQATTPDPEAMVEILLQPVGGITFLPTNLTFSSMRFGTDGGLIDVAIQQGDNEEQILTTGIKPERDSSGGVNNKASMHSLDISGAQNSGEPLKLRLYVYSLGTTKQVGFSNIVLTGTWEGSAQEEEKHTFNVKVSPENAGTVSQNPAGTAFVADTEIELSATAKAGYFFVNWTDSKGNVVGSDAKLRYVVKGNSTITANFKSEADYAYIFEDCSPYDAAVDDVHGLAIALAKAKSRSDKTARYRIFLHDGIYDFGTTALTPVVENTSLIGESLDGVLIMNNPGAVSANYQTLTPVLFIDQNQNNVYMQDLTIRQARDWDEKISRGQAIALRQRGKQAAYKNVSLQGVQDTYYLNKADASAYFEDCEISGEVDFIYGDGTMFFEHCKLYPVSSSACITASNSQAGYMGIVFNACSIERREDAKDEVTGYALGRPWGDSPAATFLNTTMHVLPTEAGWRAMSNGCVIRFHEYGSRDAEGNLLDLSARSISACAPAEGSDNPVITEAQAAEYTLEKVFKKVAANWDPKAATRQLTPSTPSLNGTTLSWEAVPGALGYAVVKNGKVWAFTTYNQYVVDDASATYSIRVANEMGGLSPLSANSSTGIESVITDSSSESPIYFNTLGQRVSPSTRGILIQKGKKTVRR